MGIEKQSSKSGVGSFLQLFDWNAKSRKKLFSSKSDCPGKLLPFPYHYVEKSKQKKRCDGSLPTTRLDMMDEDEVSARPSMKGSSVYSCASSVVTDEDLYGSKGPGVVARLMGLEPLPKPNTLEPYTPFSYSHSLPGSYYQSKTLDYRQDPQIMQLGTLQQPGVQSVTEPKYQKVKQRPIEKFQTEVLPPRSAKSIPITHHKLLSPIKSKTSIPPKDAAHIMEAAARILDTGPKVVKKPVLPLASSSLKVRDSNEKVQAAQKLFPKVSEGSQRSRGMKNTRGSSVTRSSNSGSVDAMSVSSLQDSAEVTSAVKSKGKSISLALQAKANVQKREGLSSTRSKAEVNVYSPNLLFTSQSGAQKSTPNKKPSTHKNSGVLRQNNQKQNCVADKGKPPLKKAVGGDQSSVRRQNSSKPLGTSKLSSRKSSTETRDDRSNTSSCSSERVTRKKRSIEGKVMQSADIMDTQSGGGSDVISFTFTTPLRSTEFEENRKPFPVDSPSKRMMLNADGLAASKFTFSGHNVRGGDSLSSFLEQQLKELAHKTDLSHQKSGPELHGSSVLGDHKTRSGDYSFDRLGQPGSSFRTLRHFEGMSGQKNISLDKTFLNYRHPSPVSVFEHFSFTESCNSSDSAESNRGTEGGGNKCTSLQSEDLLGRNSMNMFLSCEVDFDLSDSASSTSAGTVAKRREITLTSARHGKLKSWELDYVEMMLCGIEVMFKDYAMGRSTEIISPHMFDQLESCKKCFDGCELVSSMSRRLVFDCATECLETRCRGYAAGGYELWAKGVSTVKRKERLAEDVCKEILRWSGMGDFMVDELVESDMSCSTYGRWLDYDIEGFEVGLQIQSRILNSLIDEVVADILVL
ncbi:hypothetical protein SASPL_109489 [Salvia splendens]|uniref:DUF4378 domain-containing protein n=1 Tax=Salvia splendens TaxID=180675 RepID=A0A8X8YGF3_SALSN|nr:hypothetical protein SASPL_109489 [Salvia splendens]